MLGSIRGESSCFSYEVLGNLLERSWYCGGSCTSLVVVDYLLISTKRATKNLHARTILIRSSSLSSSVSRIIPCCRRCTEATYMEYSSALSSHSVVVMSSVRATRFRAIFDLNNLLGMIHKCYLYEFQKMCQRWDYLNIEARLLSSFLTCISLMFCAKPIII